MPCKLGLFAHQEAAPDFSAASYVCEDEVNSDIIITRNKVAIRKKPSKTHSRRANNTGEGKK